MAQFRNLIFEGGGVKGIAYAGAIRHLESLGYLQEIKRTGGTSAGAITAALLALGADSKAIEEIVGSTQFRDFMDDSFGLIRDTQRLLHDFGWYKGDAFSSWMQKQIHSLCQNSQITFAQLGKLSRDKGAPFRELFVVGTNLSLQVESVYSEETTPDWPVWEAVRVSMSMPLFFAAVKREAKQILVDGGVTWNYPIGLFDDKKFNPAPNAAQKPNYPTLYDDNHVYNKETLGFRVDTADEIKAEKESWRLPPAQIDDFFDYIKTLVGYMNDMANKLHLHKDDRHRTIFIDAGGVKSTDFTLPDDKAKMLVANGEKGAQEYFDWFNNSATDPAPINRVDHAGVTPSRRRPRGNLRSAALRPDNLRGDPKP